MHPNQNDCYGEVPAHIAAKGVAPMQGDGNAVGDEHARLAENVRGPLMTAPTGYVHDRQMCKPDVFGSGSEWYGDHWDSGFAGKGDPYGIQSEYVAQSASPNAALPSEAHAAGWVPTQAHTDAVVAQAQAEENHAVVAEPV